MEKTTFIFTDAHITGVGAMLAQGEDRKSAKPVAFASRTTSKGEAKYPQLDLEALAVDFGLRRFRHYLVGAPSTINVITDHKPLCSIFNGKRKGSIRTERIKMRHQDIQYKVEYQRGSSNQADYMSRRGKPLNSISKDEQKETEDLNNLLYTLHTTPIMDKIGLKEIAEETEKDVTLRQISKMIKNNKNWIHKSEDKNLQRFSQILPEITITGNGILLKGDRIILPTSLQATAITLAHRGSHPQQSSMEHRLRAHFFFHDMKTKVAEELEKCHLCKAFSEKKTQAPIKAHKVPSKCWETVAVDLFGPMPSSKHVVVVQDLASRFPAAKLVTSTAASKVIPVLDDIYDNFGNPEKQISDNGPPFNSKEMRSLATKRGIQLQHIPPRHPAANPAETFMKPLGKTMKIAKHTSSSEKEALQNLLSNYRDTPHNATGVTPASMMFRDGQEGTFPRISISSEQVQEARERDKTQKTMREREINEHKFRVKENIKSGDNVLMRNPYKKRKFDPTFLPETFTVVQIESDGTTLLLERRSDGAMFRRHPDDVKIFKKEILDEKKSSTTSEKEQMERWQNEWLQWEQEDEESPSSTSFFHQEEAERRQLTTPRPPRHVYLRSTPYSLRSGPR